jgi:hypothetical protein
VAAYALIQKSAALLVIVMVLSIAQAASAYSISIEDTTSGSTSQGTFAHFYYWHTDQPNGWPNCDIIEVKPSGNVLQQSNVGVDTYPPYKDGPVIMNWGYTPVSGTYGLKITDHNSGAVLATALVSYNATTGVSTPVDANGVATTQPVSGGGGSCRVWATRAGDIGTIHVDQVTLPTGDTSWAFSYKTAGATNYVPMTLPKNAITQDFNLSGQPDGTAEYVTVSFTDSSGYHVIFEGNVLFPNATDSGGTTTAPAPNSSDSGPTYQSGGPGNGQGGTTTQPVNGGGTGTTSTGGGGIGTSGNGFGTDSVWTESQPESPSTQPGTGTGTGTSGETMDARIARYKQTFLNAFGANIGGINTGGPVDKVISVNPGSIGGVSLAFAIHTVPDTSTVMGQALESIRVSMRAFLSVFIAYTLFQQCVRICRRL